MTGAGIVGICTMSRLVRAGLQVTVIDEGEPGMYCSLGNVGGVCPGSVVPLAMPAIGLAPYRPDRPRGGRSS